MNNDIQCNQHTTPLFHGAVSWCCWRASAATEGRAASPSEGFTYFTHGDTEVGRDLPSDAWHQTTLSRFPHPSSLWSAQGWGPVSQPVWYWDTQKSSINREK